MTPNKEDYLKELYKLGGGNHLVNNKDMSKALNIAPASVSEMLTKLSQEGLVEIIPYKGTRLTIEGLKIAITLLRGHRLWEVFLIRHLGYSWSEAHEDAELLEHISTNRLTTRLDKFLNYPSYCPHGSVIPKSDGTMEEIILLPLNEVTIGSEVTIHRIHEEKALLDYLQSLRIEIGSKVIIISIDPYEGPYTLLIDKKVIQISYKAVCQIFVSEL